MTEAVNLVQLDNACSFTIPTYYWLSTHVYLHIGQTVSDDRGCTVLELDNVCWVQHLITGTDFEEKLSMTMSLPTFLYNWCKRIYPYKGHSRRFHSWWKRLVWLCIGDAIFSLPLNGEKCIMLTKTEMSSLTRRCYGQNVNTRCLKDMVDARSAQSEKSKNIRHLGLVRKAFPVIADDRSRLNCRIGHAGVSSLSHLIIYLYVKTYHCKLSNVAPVTRKLAPNINPPYSAHTLVVVITWMRYRFLYSADSFEMWGDVGLPYCAKTLHTVFLLIFQFVL